MYFSEISVLLIKINLLYNLYKKKKKKYNKYKFKLILKNDRMVIWELLIILKPDY